MADLDWAELLAYFDQDQVTDAILIYMETLGSNRDHIRR